MPAVQQPCAIAAGGVLGMSSPCWSWMRSAVKLGCGIPGFILPRLLAAAWHRRRHQKQKQEPEQHPHAAVAGGGTVTVRRNCTILSDQQEGDHSFEVVAGRVNDSTADLEYCKSICYAAHRRDIGDELGGCEEPESKRPRTT